MKKTIKTSLSGLIGLSVVLAAVNAGAAEIKQRTIKVSYGTAADHPFGVGVTKFAELMAKMTDGKITVKGYPAGQLGAVVPSISSAQGGVLEMAVTSTSAVVGTVKEFPHF